MSLKFYNTLTRKKELFETIEPGKVRMYVCGPTVYSKAHIGHAMSALVFDIIRRYLEYRGYEVRYVMNYTDVDDKIIQRANAENRDPYELAETLISDFRQNLDDLGILPATVNPRATQEMEGIVEMIRELVQHTYAYDVDGDVYFRVEKDDDYGRLSNRRVEDMRSGARIEVDERKESPLDFALWKSAKPGEPFWGSPWGKGRPGWHIECSVMSRTYLGDQIDIHGGGNDLIFPHHENEIAQTESVTGKLFARFWIHNGMLQLGGEKMSKSTGNLITIEEFLRDHDGDAMRMIVLNSSYRNPLTFTDDVIAQAEKSLDRFRAALRPALPGARGLLPADAAQLAEQVETTRAGFIEAMDDDINTAGGVGKLFDLVRAINQARDLGASDADLRAAHDLMRELTGVLGLNLADRETKAGNPAADYIDLLIELRAEVRKRKMYDLSDLIRDRLAGLGVVIEDSREGSSWRFEA
ncbi:MAG: cysteine--tRNA ligase [Anaerolineaceae bacterium]|nr:cysteine--tRNA ligase [Anaerolineaceae bacterium]